MPLSKQRLPALVTTRLCCRLCRDEHFPTLRVRALLRFMMHTAALVGSPQCRLVQAITATASVEQWQAKAMLGTNPERPPATLTAESSDGLLPSRLITQRPGAIKRLILPHTAK